MTSKLYKSVTTIKDTPKGTLSLVNTVEYHSYMEESDTLIIEPRLVEFVTNDKKLMLNDTMLVNCSTIETVYRDTFKFDTGSDKKSEAIKKTFASATNVDKLLVITGRDKQGNYQVVIITDCDDTEIVAAENAMYDEMHAEELALNELSPAQKQAEKEAVEIKKVQKIVDEAEKLGADGLMTNDEIKKAIKAYIAVNNEGDDGYVPSYISQEDYSAALEILNKQSK